MKRTALGSITVLISIVAAILLADEPETQKQTSKAPAVVYYQVTYSNGDIKDLSEAPKTQKDIELVMRISRYTGSQGDKGQIVLSTDRPMTIVSPGKTISTSLLWNGTAWTAGGEKPSEEKPSSKATSQPAKEKSSTVPDETGKISLNDTCQLKGKTSGIVEPVKTAKIMPHRMQVWKLPKDEGERTYNVSIAHPEAGDAGAFHYIACTDSDGDGVPDKIIARSPKAKAKKTGQWTNWKFTTSHPNVYVGNAWDNDNTVVYSSGHRKDDEEKENNGNWGNLPKEVYVSGMLWGNKFSRYRPWIDTNMRVNLDSSDDVPLRDKRYKGDPVKVVE